MAFVRAHPGATLYHTLQWRDLIRDVFGHRPEYLVAAADGQIRGVLPLFHVTLPMVGAKLILAALRHRLGWRPGRRRRRGAGAGRAGDGGGA